LFRELFFWTFRKSRTRTREPWSTCYFRCSAVARRADKFLMAGKFEFERAMRHECHLEMNL
jgi:hypothetical protein